MQTLFRTGGLFALFLSAAPAIFAQTTHTIMVDAISDDESSLGCNLREAVDVANASITSALGCSATTEGSGSPIRYRLLLPEVTYVIGGQAGNDDNSGGDIDILAHTEIVGSGANTIIDANFVERAFDSTMTFDLALSNMTVRNGLQPNGPGTDRHGGGVRALSTSNTVQVSNVIFENNQSVNGSGGAAFTRGSTLIQNSIFHNNAAKTGAALSVTSSASFPSSIRSSQFFDNIASADGGAISSGGGPLAVVDSSFTGNAAVRGGAMFSSVTSGVTDVINSTFVSNTASSWGGALYTRQTTNILGSVFADNSAMASGGALYMSNSGQQMRVSFSTIAGNDAASGGGIFGDNTVRLRGTIVAGNMSTDDFSDCSGKFGSNGLNILGNNTGCAVAFPSGIPNANGDIVGTASIPAEPGLLSLVETAALPYFPLAADSVAIDLVPNGQCTLIANLSNVLINGATVDDDLRDAPRIGDCDAGAFEQFINISPVSDVSVNESGATQDLIVVLPFQPGADVELPVIVDDSSEIVLDQSTLIFTPSNWDSPQILQITGQDDDLLDGPVLASVIFGTSISLDPLFDGVDVVDIRVVNEDDDFAGIVLAPDSGLETSESGSSAQFGAALQSGPIGEVHLIVESTNLEEGTVLEPSQLVFDESNWQVAQLITIVGEDDEIQDGDQQYSVSVAVDPLNTDQMEYSQLDPAFAQATNLDDDMAGFAVRVVDAATLSSVAQAEEGTDGLQLRMRLESEPTADVSVSLSSSDTSEGVLSQASFVFSPQNWSDEQISTISFPTDSTIDGDVSFTLITAPAVSGDINYDDQDPSDPLITSIDIDVAEVLVDLDTQSVSENLGSSVLTVSLSAIPTEPVTIRLDGLSDRLVSQPEAAVIDLSNWDTGVEFNVSAIDNDIDDDDISVDFQAIVDETDDPDFQAARSSLVTLTILDDDTATLLVTVDDPLETAEPAESAEIVISLSSQPTAEVTVSAQTSDEGEAIVGSSLVFDASNWSIEQSLRVTGVDDAEMDGDQTYTIELFVQSDDVKYDGLSRPPIQAINIDDDLGDSVFLSGFESPAAF